MVAIWSTIYIWDPFISDPFGTFESICRLAVWFMIYIESFRYLNMCYIADLQFDPWFISNRSNAWICVISNHSDAWICRSAGWSTIYIRCLNRWWISLLAIWSTIHILMDSPTRQHLEREERREEREKRGILTQRGEREREREKESVWEREERIDREIGR